MSFAPNLGGYSGKGLGGASGGVLGFLSQLLGGYEAGHKEHLEEQQQKQENAFKQQEMAQQAQQNALNTKVTEAKLSQDQQAAAQSRIGAIMPAIFTDPSKASDPAYVKSITDAYAQMGLPAPLKTDKDGKQSVDVSPFQKDFTSLDPKQQQLYLQLDPAQRKPLLDGLVAQGYRIPKEFYTNKAFVDAKDQAAIDRVQVSSQHEKAWENVQNKRTEFQRQRTEALDKGDLARVNELDARTALYTAQVPAIKQRLEQGQQRLNLEQQRLNDIMTRWRSSPHSQQTQLLTQSRQALQAYNQVSRSLDDDITKRDQMVANGANLDDPELRDINDRISTLTDQLSGLKDLQSEAANNLISGLNVSSSVAASSSKPANVVSNGPKPIGNAPSGASDGYYPNAKGGPVTIKNGKMYRGQV